MIRFVLYVVAVLTLLSLAIILVARAQPYDDGGLREMLFSNDCQPPCFMGIRPGITTKDEAIQHLQATSWVAGITLERREIAWEWNGRQPALLHNDKIGNRLSFDQHEVVYKIDAMTAANVGTFTLLLGTPAAWGIWNLGIKGNPSQLNQIAIYPSYPMILSGAADCPVSLHDQWTLPVQISLYNIYDKSGGIWGASLAKLRPLAEYAC